MGFFSSKKIVVVSSTVYNLLGDKAPIDFMSNSVLDAVINPKSNMSLAEDLYYKVSNGPAGNFRKYMQWTKRSNYQTHIGLATSTYHNMNVLSDEEIRNILKSYLNLDDSTSVNLVQTKFEGYNMYLVADAWVVNNRPDQMDTAYTVSDKAIRQSELSRSIFGFNRDPVVRYDLVITFIDGSTVQIRQDQYDTSKQYAYIKYYLLDSNNNKIYQYLVYAQGSGNTTLDKLFTTPQTLSNTYSAFLPFRAWNSFLGDNYYPKVYALAKRGSNLAIGDNKYMEIRKAIANNSSINEIDFAYLHFGVPINIPYDFGKAYIFNYFYNLASFANTYEGVAVKCHTEMLGEGTASNPAYTYYYDDYGHSTSFEFQSRLTVYPGGVYIKSPGTSLNFDIRTNWDNLLRSTKTGKAKPDAKPGNYYIWYEKLKVFIGYGIDWVFVSDGMDSGSGGHYEKKYVEFYLDEDALFLAHQETENRYVEIQIWEAEQLNYIYKGKYTASYAVDTFPTPGISYGSFGTIKKQTKLPDDLSDFIIPIQYNTFLETNMAKMDTTMQCCYNLIFNCYKEYKRKWYQSGFFRFLCIVVIVIIIVVAYIYSGPGGAGATSLASSIGGVTAAAIGLTVGTMAYIIVASAINAICAIVLAKVVSAVAVKAFGEKLGAIIGAIASIYISCGISVDSFSISAVADSIATNIPAFTASVAMQGGNAYANILQLKAKSVLAKINDLYISYTDKMEEIQEKTEELLGYNQYSPIFLASILDPTEPYVYEDRDTFLSRTLLLGSDIVDLTLNSISQFVDTNLSLSLA